LDELRDARAVGHDVDDAVEPEAVEATSEELDARQDIVDDDWFVDVELEVSLRRCEGHRGVISEHLRADHRERLTLRRVYLARHDRGAGLVCGQYDFPKA